MNFTVKLALRMLKSLILIRETEEKIAQEYAKQDMKCPVHLSIGQEVASVGACLNLRHKDHVYAGHRGHGPYIAKGGDLRKMISEIYGKETGCSGGRGGSMHIIDRKVGFMGTSAIVGGIIPIAVGDAFTAKIKRSNRIVVVFFGDGAVEEGVFYECMKFASLHKLRIVFVCENNSLAVDTPLHVRQPNNDIYKRGEALGVKGYKADGNDAVLTFTTFQEALTHVLKDYGPVLLEFTVERWADHVGPRWKSTLNCPIESLKKRLLEGGVVSGGQIKEIYREVKEKVNDAFSFAKKSHFPKTSLKTRKRLSSVEHKSGGLQQETSYAEALNKGLDQMMAKDDTVVVIGLGTDYPNAIFGSLSGLAEKYGKRRVFDTPLSEEALTGICLGLSLEGLKPVLVHARVEFSLLSMNQIINHLAQWEFTYGRQTPVVIRMIIGKGWGQGPQHSQSLQSLFAHIPGLKVVMPATAYDAKGLLVSALCGKGPVIFIEHRRLYDKREEIPTGLYKVPIGKARVVKEGKDITIVAVSYMLHEVIGAMEILSKEGIDVEVIDLRSIAPIDIETIVKSVSKTGRLVVCDTGWKMCGVSAEVSAIVAEHCSLKSPVRRITLPEHQTPTSWVLEDTYYPSASDIVKSCMKMMDRKEILSNKKTSEESSFEGPF